MKDFCLFACSDQFQLPEKGLDYVGVIQNLCQQLGIVLTHFAYDLDRDVYGKRPTNEGRFDPDGVARLKQVITERSLYQLALWSDYDEHPYFDLRSELNDSNRFGFYSYAYIQFPLHHEVNPISTDLFSFVSSLLSSLNRIGQMDYALVTMMDSALPATFFLNVFTTNLSDDEALNLATWKIKLEERKTKLRGLYWGNLLGPGHLSQLTDRQAFLARLEALIGSQRLTTINGDALFFMLPSPDMISDPAAASVESLLKEQDLLMQPDDRAREMVNSSLTRLYARKR